MSNYPYPHTYSANIGTYFRVILGTDHDSIVTSYYIIIVTVVFDFFPVDIRQNVCIRVWGVYSRRRLEVTRTTDRYFVLGCILHRRLDDCRLKMVSIRSVVKSCQNIYQCDTAIVDQRPSLPACASVKGISRVKVLNRSTENRFNNNISVHRYV